VNVREEMAALTKELHGIAARRPGPLSLMEVCGTHTVSAFRGGLHSLMPDGIRLVSGPGCPVCVTAQRYIDALIGLGRRENVVLATYGDMMRVAGEGGSLELARSEGADVRVVTSSLEALAIAADEPEREVVFAAVGFETTAPATAAAILAARRRELPNFFVLPCHKLVLPAMVTLLSDPECRIDGFLCPGHVSVVLGAETYRPVVEEFGKPGARRSSRTSTPRSFPRAATRWRAS
jgi:hydrogenase expression/formation protein HypD